MIKRILVALDGSVRAAGVFDAAAELAERFGATLFPFRALDIPPEFPAAAASSRADPLPAFMANAAIGEMLKLAERAPGIDVDRPTAKEGQPWRMILQAAEELDVDLIVMGSHGYHGLDRILGTTAGKVANLAHRNVLVVHNREAMPPAGPSSASLLAGS
jgi:nucleotide-binding universal stress UspA family protein